MNENVQVFTSLLEEKQSELPSSVRASIVDFYSTVLKENEIQNLTRLISPQDFYEGHLIDVLELLKLEWVGYPALDLGSGVGVPGILAALIKDGQWVLAESEKRKAEYLRRAVDILSLEGRVQVTDQRGEEYLKHQSVCSVVIRAVGSIEKIYTWIRKCSTWNNLILFKGPSWDEEWATFHQTRLGSELKFQREYGYSVGNEGKKRKIIQLSRVPRGTSKGSLK